MLRFIMRRRWKDTESQASGERFYTIDGNLELLEQDLRSNGYGPNGYKLKELVGVEILDYTPTTSSSAKTAVEEIATWPSWKIKAAKAAFMEPKNE